MRWNTVNFNSSSQRYIVVTDRFLFNHQYSKIIGGRRGQNQHCKRHLLSFVQKCEVLEDVKKKLLCRVIARKYGISIGHVSSIKSKENEYTKQTTRENSIYVKRKWCPVQFDIDRESYEFLVWLRYQSNPVPNLIVREHAKYLADKKDLKNFSASPVWALKISVSAFNTKICEAT